MKKDFQDRIDEYILGRMSNDEKAQFEAEVNQDESKKEQFEFTRNVKSTINSREDKLKRMKMMQGMYDHKHRQVAASMRATGTDDSQYTPAPQYAEKKPSRRIWWLASGIAAVLVIVFFVINPNKELPNNTNFPTDIIFNDNMYKFGIDSIMQNDIEINDTIPKDTTIIIEKK